MPFLRKSLAKAYCNSISTKFPQFRRKSSSSRGNQEREVETYASALTKTVRVTHFGCCSASLSKWLVGEGVWRGWDFD